MSKLAEMEARVLLPLGEGGPKGRMRVHFLPSPGASRHPLPKGEGHAATLSPCRAGIRSAHLIDGCALSGWHSLRSSSADDHISDL